MAVSFQLGIDNASPAITYNPFPNTIAEDATAGWTSYYTNSGFPSTLGLVGNGTGFQISSKDGSFFSITWFGTGIDLYGNATNAALNISLDRKDGGQTSGDALVGTNSNLLASFSDLSLDTYTVTLTARTSSSPSSFLAFERAILTSAVEVANLDNLTVHSETVDDGEVAYNGQWSTFQSSTIAPATRFHATTELGDSAHLVFNGTAVSVFGLREPDSGYYNVTLDGETTQYEAQSVWVEGAVLFYMTGLDPERTHSLTITNAANNRLAVGYINTTSVSGVPLQTSTSVVGIPKGAIAGIAAGIFLGVAIFLVLGFILWRRRRRGDGRDFTFIEPSIHKGYDITEAINGVIGQRRKPHAQSPASEVSLDLFPVTIPQTISPLSRPSPPTFPRSPTLSSPSQTKSSHDDSGRDAIGPPEPIDQYLGPHMQSPRTVESRNAPSPGFSRRSSVPRPSGPRPQSYRTSIGDPWTSVFTPPARIVNEPDPTKIEELPENPEPKMQKVNEQGELITYSFLDMNSTSRTSSIKEGPGKSRNSVPPLPHANPDSPPHPAIITPDPARSHRDSDRHRESRSSKRLSLSAVIRQLPALKIRQSTELHPYSPHPPHTSRSHRPPTGGASPTESVPVTEVSEIRFFDAGEASGSGGSIQRSRPTSRSPSPKPTTVTSQIHQKLFGTHQEEVPPDGLLAKKRPLRRKQLSISTFNRSPRV